MKLAIAFGIVTLGLCYAAQAQDVQKPSDGVELIGAYEIVAGERGGEKIAPERLEGVKVRIGADAITTFDKDKKEVYAATYKLDASRKPWGIAMTATMPPSDEGKGEKAAGLIELKGDTVKLIYALPGGKAPTDFKTGEKQQMFILKRAEK